MPGKAQDVDSAGSVLDAEQNIDPRQNHRVDVQEIGGVTIAEPGGATRWVRALKPGSVDQVRW
jgi:hypothetical protein